MPSTNTLPDLPIIFEDDHLLVINKPHGVLSQKDHTRDADVLSLCKTYLAEKSSKKTKPYLGLLHRLDRPVGGLMMLAKTPQAAKAMSQQMRDRLVQKTYHAVVQNDTPANGLLTHHLSKNNQTNVVKTVPADHPQGKEAILTFRRLKRSNELTLLEIHLQTGRSHQIRVQLAAEGYPIWGDYKYGIDQPDGRTMALQSVELVFNHPATNEEVRIELPAPDRDPWNRFG